MHERVIPIAIGVGSGLALGLVNAFLLGRLTLSMTTPIDLVDVLINGVIGCVAVSAIGLIAAMLAATYARNHGADASPARTTGLIAGIVPAVLIVGLGLTIPLHLGTVAVQMLLAVLAPLYAANRFSA